jgi:RNA polymerase sigma-70 factor (ECF subfamily)
MLPSHADTDDVLQNTFVKIWSNLGKFQGKSKVFSWCYRIAINESLHWIAKNKKHQASPLNDTVTPVVSQSAHLYTDGNEIASMLSRAVDTLPEQQKRVFELRYYEDMKYAEIAQQLSLSPGGLKANYHHAVKKIEAFIKLNATH